MALNSNKWNFNRSFFMQRGSDSARTAYSTLTILIDKEKF